MNTNYIFVIFAAIGLLFAILAIFDYRSTDAGRSIRFRTKRKVSVIFLVVAALLFYTTT